MIAVDTQDILLILIAVVLVFGIGVVLLNRRSRGGSPGVPPVVSRPIEREPAPEPEPDLAPRPEVHDEPEQEPEPEIESVVEAPSFRSRMGKAAAVLAGAFGGVRARSGITDDTWDDLEEALLRADVGLGVTTSLLDGLRERVSNKEISSPDELLDALRGEMVGRLAGADRGLHRTAADDQVDVWLFVGVNGVGKTTTIGKVSAQQTAAGLSVVLAAGDTFRAAAAEQLGTWAERSGAELVRGAEGGDPSSVVFDGVQRAKSRGADLVLGDTAGRLQNKSNLMDELRKVRRVADRDPGHVSEVLLVIDATTGQNGLSQAREFTEAAGVTGVVLTKLDGSAKGGIVFAIETEFGIPVKLVGLGETIGDLVPFDPDEFVGALFSS
ncbi:MAG: signal recognition particle-docking protein FtsY [Actinomycetota bacterium]|nr:signal recognition particle-docking protein FtsY [Actinomycetota bacterium]MDA3011825.1 signal recognition particle-docking protein FtsY [Actinomycetota bacterium]